MGLTRRAFFQHTGMALTGLGVSQLDLTVLGDRYAQALAQPTRRKLALLIGINQYPESVCDCALTKGSALGGCITDVALQQELLIHRFGFQPADIVTLCDQSATRAAIATTFLEHLTAQARSGDVVVVHFSGLGSHLRFADAPDALRHSLVPVDGYLPTAEQPVINDLMTETLSLLVRSLQTEQVTTILDTSYAYPSHQGLQGNLRVRSRPSTPTGQINPQERALQERLLNQVGASDQQIRQQWQTGQLPGIVLSAASRGQSATEGQWDGFSAGLLTYALTQHLWHVVAPT
ncbi:MAG TPA: caspase family protein, partial [Chroococcidiopsis sp.]